MQGVTLKSFTAQEADEVSLTQSKFLSGLCSVGVSSEVLGQPGEDTIRELGNPPRVQGHIHSKIFKSKNIWKKKITTCEKQALLNSLSNTKAIWMLFSLGKLLETLLSQIRKAEVPEEQWFLLTVVWFSQQRQEGSKGFLPGYKLTQVQTHPRGREERQGSEARAERPFLHWTMVFSLSRILTSYVIKLTEKQFLLHSTELHMLLLNITQYSTAHLKQLRWLCFMLFCLPQFLKNIMVKEAYFTLCIFYYNYKYFFKTHITQVSHQLDFGKNL